VKKAWGVAFVAVCLIYICLGATQWYFPWEWSRHPEIVFTIRITRLIACIACGAILASVGSCFQMVFRNPLAEPYVLGVSSGAALGGGLAMAFGFFEAVGHMGGLACAIAGGLLSLQLILTLARGRVQMQQLLLTGVILASLLASLNTLLLLLAGKDTNVVLRWMLGSMADTFSAKNYVLIACAALGLPFLWTLSRRLNALSLGEESARALGVDTGALTKKALYVGTILTSAVVGAVGIIGFVGLVAPHVVRIAMGADLRKVLPWSAVVGAMMVTVADLVAQRLLYGDTLPVGAVTALLGAPALFWVLKPARS